MTSQWRSLGQVSVTDSWNLLPNDSFDSDTFRITTTVSASDWENKVRSGVYIKFKYQLNFNEYVESRKFYIPVSDSKTIYDFPIPKELRNDGILVRSISCRLSSQYAGKFSLGSFASILLGVDESFGDTETTERQLIQQIADDLILVKNHLGI